MSTKFRVLSRRSMVVGYGRKLQTARVQPCAVCNIYRIPPGKKRKHDHGERGNQNPTGYAVSRNIIGQTFGQFP